MIGWLACSLAGHDKNKIYIIIEETNEYVWLADGDIRRLENPKCKRRKHIQVIKRIMDENLAAKLQEKAKSNTVNADELNPVCMNEAIKRAIKLYKQSLAERK